MNRDLENGFGQEDERLRSRSRQRRNSAGIGADSDTAFPRRSRAGAEDGSTGRPAGAGGRPGPAVRGRDGREAYTGQEAGSRAAAENRAAGSRAASGNRAAGSRAAAENRMTGSRSAMENRMSGGRTAAGGPMAGSPVPGRRMAGTSGAIDGRMAGTSGAAEGRMAVGRTSAEGQVSGGQGPADGRVNGNRAGADVRAAGNRVAAEGRVTGSRAAAGGRAAGSRTSADDRVTGSRTSADDRGAGSPGTADNRPAGSPGTADGRMIGSRAAADKRTAGTRGTAGNPMAGKSGMADNRMAVSRRDTDNRMTGERGTAGTRPSRIYTPETNLGEDRGRGGRENAFRRNDKDGPDGPGRKSVREAAAADSSGNGGRRKVRTIVALIIAEVFALLIIFGARYVLQQANRIQRDPNFKIEDETNPYLAIDKVENMQGYWTVALFGVDSRDNSLGKGNNTDVIIIANVNQANGEIKLVSIFRDTYLNLDDDGTYNKINQAYARGGPKQAIKALNKNLDIQIDDYATFNWKAVADSINILGGVDIELSKAEFYYINAYITETVEATGVASQHLKSAGMNHLDGVQAVAYARLRKMDTDFARTERQREIIQQCFVKLRQANFSVINNVMEVASRTIRNR